MKPHSTLAPGILLLALALALPAQNPPAAQNPPPAPNPPAAQNPLPVESPEVGADGSVTFRLRAPGAEAVQVRGQWDRREVAMSKDEKGLWAVTLPGVPPGVWEYSFLVDGLAMIDPGNPAQKPQRRPVASILHLPGNPPQPWDFQDVPHGTVHQHTYLSRALGKARSVFVYTPPGYESGAVKEYPLLVLQHGSGDRHDTWVQHGKAHWILDNLTAAGKARPMVVLMLDGHPLGQVGRGDDSRRAQSLRAFQRELFEDALPLVESHYRVARERDRRALAGLSMGGWQSLSTGLNHLERFAWIGSFSGAVRVEEIQAALQDSEGTNARLRLLWIACGEKDFLLEDNQGLTASLTKHGVKHVWRLTPGDHSWPIWRQYLADFAPLLFRD